MTRLKRSDTILVQLIAGHKLSCLFKIGKKKTAIVSMFYNNRILRSEIYVTVTFETSNMANELRRSRAMKPRGE